MILLFGMVFHFFVDALCGSALLGCVVEDNPENAFQLVFLYNLLAFATQIFTGWLADKVKHDRWLWHLSIVMVVSGATGALEQPWLAIVLLGLGNSLFHVSAGREIIRRHTHTGHGKARELGLFVAPGALGIGLGCLFPMELWMVSLAGIFLTFCLFCWLWPDGTPETPMAENESKHAEFQHIMAAGMMTFCVFCRAAAGFCGPSPWKNSAWLSVLCFLLVMVGKMVGGFMGDRYGHWRIGVGALAVSWLLFAFGGESIVLALSAQFIANLLMAITLYVLVKLYPASPGLMFGLTAAVLFPGALMQFLPNHTTIFSIAYLLACVSFGIAWRICTKQLGDKCLC